MKAGERLARQLVYARSNSVCEACGMQRATEWQHRMPRSVLGRWTAANGLHLCCTCHRWIDDNPRDANALGQHLYSWQAPERTPVKVFGRGWVLLDNSGGVQPTTPPDTTRSAA